MHTGIATTEKRATYRSAIVQVIEDYHRLNLKADSDLESIAICDDRGQNYLLVLAGWRGSERIKRVQIHLRLRDDRVWIEEDWTEDGTIGDLMRLGVDREAIVLAFLPPTVRSMECLDV
jgi:hypothetical protein